MKIISIVTVVNRSWTEDDSGYFIFEPAKPKLAYKVLCDCQTLFIQEISDDMTSIKCPTCNRIVSVDRIKFGETSLTNVIA